MQRPLRSNFWLHGNLCSYRTLCSPPQAFHLRYSVLTPKVHPSDTPLQVLCLTPSGFSPQVLRAFPLRYFSSCTSYRQVSYRQVHRAHLFRYSVLIPMLGAAITYAQVGKLRISMFTSLLPAHPAQVPCAHTCSVTPFSPYAHLSEQGTLCSPCSGALSSPCSGTPFHPAQVPCAHPCSGYICIEHKNKNLWEYKMFREQTNLRRRDTVGHEANVTALLCNLHPCHSGLPQLSYHDE